MKVHTRTLDQVVCTARQLARKIKIPENKILGNHVDLSQVGSLLSFAFPERIAMARSGQRGFFLMASGAGVKVHPEDPLAGASFIVAAQMDGQGNNAKIFLGTAHDGSCVERDFCDKIVEKEIIAWDENTKSVKARQERRYGALLLSTSVLKKVDAQKMAMVMVEGIRTEGLFILPWTKALRTWQARVCFLLSTGNYLDFSPLDDAFLLDTLESWLLPFLNGISSAGALKRVDLTSALESLLTWEQLRQIKTDAPTHITVPSGSRIPLVYGDTSIASAKINIPAAPTDKSKHSGQENSVTTSPDKKGTPDGPVLPVRLQEMFGCIDTPTIARGSVPVTLHLLSPAGRPVQITRDLKSFWDNTYIDVKKDLKGRYPRHYWPDNPLEAQPTRRAKPKSSNKKRYQ